MVVLDLDGLSQKIKVPKFFKCLRNTAVLVLKK